MISGSNGRCLTMRLVAVNIPPKGRSYYRHEMPGEWTEKAAHPMRLEKKKEPVSQTGQRTKERRMISGIMDAVFRHRMPEEIGDRR